MDDSKRYYYVEIDNDDFCIGVYDLKGEVISPTLIPIPSYDTEYLGKRYVRSTNSWIPKNVVPVKNLPIEKSEVEIRLEKIESILEMLINKL